MQVYASNLNSSLSRPKQQLIAFKRVPLEAGEKKTVSMPVQVSSFAYWDDAANKWTLERDTIGLRLGSSSQDKACP